MNPDGDYLDRVEAILREVRSATKQERDALLHERCGDDDELMREVEGMLHAEAQVGDQFLNRPLVARMQGQLPTRAKRIGPWAVGEPLGAGGMGAVFRGHRADGVFEAEVAIKFISAGVFDPNHRGMHDRFVRERQILATLDHPNISRLLDGGITDDGQPFFVMELVHGRSLIEHCDANRATLDARLRLFDEVCQAVQHAHGNLIVHRDLKPSNILVDESGRPRLLDFGIAGILSDADGPDTITATAERRFTPQYAAPEQVRGEAVTVATDVYSLGMILYELLTGARPYEVTSGYTPQDARTICETEPPRPSRRWDATADNPTTDIASIARARGMEPASLRRALKGDLDHIVMTALRKEPPRRYATVEALREDLQRYRRGLPVSARPDSWRYRTARFVGRHRVSVAATVTLGAALVAAVVLLTTLALRLNERSDALSEALSERQQALDEANVQREAAEREFLRARLGNMVPINTLAAVAAADDDSRQRIVDDIRLRSERLESGEVPFTVEARIAMRHALAEMATYIEAFDEALVQHREVLALAEDRPEEASTRAYTLFRIGSIHVQRGEAADAIEALSKAVEEHRAVHAFDHLYPQDNELTESHVLLMEAHLMAGDAPAAQAIAHEHEILPRPASHFRREKVRDLELRFGVSLLPSDDADR